MLHVLSKAAIFLCLVMMALPALSAEDPLFLVASDFDVAIEAQARPETPLAPRLTPQGQQDLQNILDLLRQRRIQIERSKRAAAATRAPVGSASL